MRPAAIFWDMDGTLTDSEPLWGEATYAMSEQLGRRLTPERRAQTIGSTFANTLSICADHAGVELAPGDETRWRDWMFSTVGDLFAQRLEVFPGVEELLKQLAADGIPMLVTTNTVRSVADNAIDRVGREFFTDTICGDEVAAGKPEPDMYIEAARRVGAEPRNCLVFEDSTAGMTAAVAAGCRVIGLPADDTVVVADGAVPIRTLHEHQHLWPAQAEDVYRWFGHLGLSAEPRR